MFNKNKKQIDQTHRHQQPANDGFDMSAYRRGTTLNSFKGEMMSKTERQRLKRLRSLRRRMAAVLLGIGVVLVLGFSLLMQFTGSVSGVAVDANIQLTETDKQKYIRLADEYLAQNSFERFSFARRNSVLLQYIESKAPEVAGAKLVTSGITTSRLELTMRRPVAMWMAGDKTSFVDEMGVVFSRNYYNAPSIVIEDKSGAKVDDKVATSAKFLSFIGKTVVEIERNAELRVARVVIPSGSVRYVEFYLEGRNYPFKAQITRNAYSQAHDIATMVRYIDSRGINPAYVDCRVEGKAYWK